MQSREIIQALHCKTLKSATVRCLQCGAIYCSYMRCTGVFFCGKCNFGQFTAVQFQWKPMQCWNVMQKIECGAAPGYTEVVCIRTDVGAGRSCGQCATCKYNAEDWVRCHSGCSAMQYRGGSVEIIECRRQCLVCASHNCVQCNLRKIMQYRAAVQLLAIEVQCSGEHWVRC